MHLLCGQLDVLNLCQDVISSLSQRSQHFDLLVCPTSATTSQLSSHEPQPPHLLSGQLDLLDLSQYVISRVS